MLDVAVSYNRYKFIGQEFLTWLWFVVETEQAGPKEAEAGGPYLEIGNRVVLENRQGDALEIISIIGDDAGFEEGKLALRKGAIVVELNLCYREQEQEWRFTVKGESLSFFGLRCPALGAIENPEDVEAAVLEKAYVLEKVIEVVDRFFYRFISLRVSTEWPKRLVPEMRKWVERSHKRIRRAVS
jgi:hypothetical protein